MRALPHSSVFRLLLLCPLVLILSPRRAGAAAVVVSVDNEYDDENRLHSDSSSDSKLDPHMGMMHHHHQHNGSHHHTEECPPGEHTPHGEMMHKHNRHHARALDFSLVNRDASSFQNVTFNWTITDMDTMLAYTPSSTGSAKATWSNTFSGSETPLAGQSVVGQGQSAHSTSFAGAFVTISFVGTGIYCMGEHTDASLLFTVDGANIPFDPSKLKAPLLAYANAPTNKLTYGSHTAVLSLLGGSVSLHNCSIETSVLTQAPSFAASRHTESLVLDASSNKPSSSFKFSGTWDTVSAIGGDNSTSSVPYSALNGHPDSSFTYSIPENSNFLFINGSSQPGPAFYSVTVDPAPPYTSAKTANINAQQSFCNGVNLFMTPLDREKSYTLTFSVTGVQTGVVGVHSVTTFSSIWSASDDDPPTTTGGSTAAPTATSGGPTNPSPPQSSSTNVGIIVGAVVGGVGAIAVLVAVLIGACALLKRRNRKRNSTAPRNEMFVVDEDLISTPYVMPQRMSLASQSSTTPLTDPTPPIPPVNPTARRRTVSFSGLGVANPDRTTGLETNTQDPAMAAHNVAQQKRAAARASQFNNEFGIQERDAGPMTVPPSYDPSWAGDYPLTDLHETSTAGNRLSGGSLGSSGPSHTQYPPTKRGT